MELLKSLFMVTGVGILLGAGLPALFSLSIHFLSPGPDGKLAPHAWLMADEMIVLGGSSADYAAHRMLHDYTLPGQRPAPAAEAGR